MALPAWIGAIDLAAGSPLMKHLAPLAASFIVALLATPIVRRVAVRLELYDRPDGGLKPHQQPIPYLGGVAMYFGWAAAMIASAWLGFRTAASQPSTFWVMLGGTVLMLTGLIDDIRHLRPRTRLLVQAAVAALLVSGGIGDGIAEKLIAPVRESLPAFCTARPVLLGASGFFCMIAIAGATNSTNLIDGLDGLCGGVLAIAAAGLAYLNWHLSNVPGIDAGGDALRTTLTLGLFGACAAFLIFNFNPARIFMGDSGSLLLGFTVAVVMILFADQASPRWFACSLMVFAFPILDTALAIGRRALNGRPLFKGDRSHFYDQVRDRGFSVRQTVLLCYALASVFAILGGVMTWLRPSSLVFILVAGPILAGALCWRFGMLKVDDTADRS